MRVHCILNPDFKHHQRFLHVHLTCTCTYKTIISMYSYSCSGIPLTGLTSVLILYFIMEYCHMVSCADLNHKGNGTVCDFGPMQPMTEDLN